MRDRKTASLSADAAVLPDAAEAVLAAAEEPEPPQPASGEAASTAVSLRLIDSRRSEPIMTATFLAMVPPWGCQSDNAA